MVQDYYENEDELGAIKCSFCGSEDVDQYSMFCNNCLRYIAAIDDDDLIINPEEVFDI